MRAGICCFSNSLTIAAATLWLMGKAGLWIHGHTHDSFDYEVAGTRVICNPKGYHIENRAFQSDLTVTV